MTTTDWREAAKGIPVWEGSPVYVWQWHREWVADVVAFVNNEHGFFRGYRGGLAVGLPLAIPQLDNPDTQAAYLRRLALALGAPDEAVGRGVAFVPLRRGGGWRIAAGLSDQVYDDNGAREALEWDWERVVSASGTDPLLPLALAWPADKRVPHAPSR